PVSNSEILDVTVIFSEPMNTGSAIVTAGMESPYDDITATMTGWSSTNCPDDPDYRDTWHGTLGGLVFLEGEMTLSIQAEDVDNNGLMNPSSTLAEWRYNDTHHDFTLESSGDSWTVTLHDYVNGSPVLSDLDDDGDLDVIVQCTDGYVHVLADDGSSWNENWPMSSGGWGSINVKSCPSIVDLNGGGLDILSVHACGCHARDLSTGGNISNWPVIMGGSEALGFYPSMSSPVIGDVDSDGYPEMILCRHLSDSTILEPTVYLFEHTGGAWTWRRNLETGGSSVISTPAVGDVSSSHFGMEIVVCTAEGYQTDGDSESSKDYNSAVYLLDPDNGLDIVSPAYYNCWFWASPVVADIDDDGVNEIIVGTGISGTSSRKVLVLNGNTLNEEHVWNVGSMVKHPVAIGDMNDDGILDVVAVDNSGKVNCWYWSGDEYQSLPGFPVSIEGIPAAPSIVNIDGDIELEIVVGTGDGYLYAINSDGSICSGYPVSCGSGVFGQVAIGNIDDDNGLEMIFADDINPVLYCYDLGAGTFPAEMPWRQFQHDSWHTGCIDA
ncbi:MAG: hypothetical protein K8R76_02575, partial [Candidatus Aegiribacteria sp.]|nr:hypothetical protein [Candidatus Aegiribacteria sp.]